MEGEPAIRQQVAWALVNKGVALGALGRREEEIAVYDAIDARFGGEGEPAIHELVAWALVNKGTALDALGRGEEAIAVYGALDARFGGESEPSIRKLFARGQVRRGNLKHDLHGDFDAAELTYRLAISLDVSSEVARENLAWLLITVGRTDEVLALRTELRSIPPTGLALLDAGLELANDNFGSAMELLGRALALGLTTAGWDFFDDLLRLAPPR